MPNDVKQIRLRSAVIGLIFMGLGGLLIYQIFFQGVLVIRENTMGMIFILGPTVFFYGTLTLIRGIIWKKNAFSGRNVLYSGLFMLIIGIYPFVSLLLGDPEAGLDRNFGLFIIISICFPGILLSIVGLFIRNLNRN